MVKAALAKMKEASPDPSKPYTIIGDWSATSIGGILCQEHDGVLRPVAFRSRRLLPRESRSPQQTPNRFVCPSNVYVRLKLIRGNPSLLES